MHYFSDKNETDYLEIPGALIVRVQPVTFSRLFITIFFLNISVVIEPESCNDVVSVEM